VDYLERTDKPFCNRELLPCIAIPTTAGTGSEATHFSVVYKNKVKFSVADPRMIPATVILNPALTAQMSPYQTACTGMDALAQGIESYWAVGATGESWEYAEKAIRQAWLFLEKAVKNPDTESRQNMLEAAYWSGRAINISKTTLCHALSYSLTSYFGYPHGHAVALLLPAVFELHLRNGIISKELFGFFDCRDGREAQIKLGEMMLRIGMVLMDDFTLNDIELIVSQVNPERMRNNPLIASRDVIHALLTAALVGTKDNH
jgi:alcohol dehydrogenase class IV